MHHMVGGHFMSPNLSTAGLEAGPSMPLFTRGSNIKPEHVEFINTLQRSEVVGDLASIQQQLGITLNELVRGITSGMTAFPVRENLEAEAKVLIPKDTPVRNFLPRKIGAGLASNWRQVSSLGGGWGSAATMDQPGGGTATRMFFTESGAPAEFTTVYANRSASYKLMGVLGQVTGFSMAAGANFQNQLAVEKANALSNLMLNEEFALIAAPQSGQNDMYGTASTAAPWGDGAATNLSYEGLWSSIRTGNGTPSAHVAAAVGSLTLSHLDNQLTRIWKQGGRDMYMVMNAQEVISMAHLAEANGSIIRVAATGTSEAVLGIQVTGYKHPVTGEIVPILASRFLAPGEIIFGSKYLPDGSPAADVEVLPQVQLPELAPNQNVMGYTAQELAPTSAAPQVYPFVITLYSVFRLKSGTVFAKSSGVTAV